MPRIDNATAGVAAPALEIVEGIPRLTLRQLSYFLAAATHQSIRKAAQALHVSAPSVSMAISQIEAMMEAQLFVRRHARGLVLTEAGRDLAVSARNMLAYAREIETAGHGGATAYPGRLNVGCLVTVAPFLIPPLLSALASSHPRLQIRWREGNHEGLVDGLETGTLDLAILYDFDVPRTLHCTPLRTMPLQVVVHADHRLAPRPAISLLDVIDEPLILLDLPKSRDYFLSVFGDLGVEPRIAHRTPSFEMLRSLVANGLGYSLLNFCPPTSFPHHGAIVSRPLIETSRPAHLVLARLHRYRAPAIIDEFTRRARDLSTILPVNALPDGGEVSQNRRLRPVRPGFPQADARVSARRPQTSSRKVLP
jgi:DNA-binding transcriptional LysR family regulator